MVEIVNGPRDDFVLRRHEGVREDRGRGPSTALEGTSRIETSLDGLTPDQIPAWRDVFLPYKNLAGDEKIAERALSYVRSVKRNYWERTQRIRRRWRTLQYLLKGNTLHNWQDPYAIHSPQLYLAEETVVPRMEEAVMGEPRWFSAEGVKESDQQTHEKIRAFIMSQLDQADWEHLNQPIFRTFYEYAFCAVKEEWAFDTKHVIDRNAREIEGSFPPQFEFTLEEKEVITYQGPRYNICEPEGFLVDPTRRDAHEGAYIGDQSLWFYDDVAALGEQGLFMNWKSLREEPPKDDEQWNEWQKRARRLTDSTYLERNAEEGAPHETWITDLWCKFDLFNTGRTRECVITVANDRVVLRVQENPFDDKHRPYSVATFSENPFEFFSVGPLDRAIPTQIELDRVRDLGIKSGELSICPVAIVPPGSDFPDSLAGIRPGSVLRSSKMPEWMTVKPVIRDALAWEAVLKNEIQALTASPDILTGMEDDPTATGTLKRIEEANKRLKGFISAYTRLANQMLLHTHAMNQQFVTKQMKFKALGTDAVNLREYEWIGPLELQWDVRFKFRAISNLKTLGMRQSRLMQWMQTFMPLVQADPSRVNIGELLVHSANLYLGDDSERRFIKQDSDPSVLLDQLSELLIIQDGGYVPVRAEDDHEEHIEILDVYTESDQFKDLHPSTQSAVAEHHASHLQAMTQLEVQRNAKRSPGFMDQGPLPIAGQGSAPGKTNQAGGAVPAFQLPGQTLGEQPGPSNQERMRTPGRNAPVPQEQNMGV